MSTKLTYGPDAAEAGQPAPRLLLLSLMQAVYWFDEGLQGALKARGWPGLTRSQSMVVMNVAAGVTRPAAIARNMGVTRQAMSQTLADMEAAGLLGTEADPKDRRAKRVTFAPGSETIRAQAMEILLGLEAKIAARVGTGRFVAMTCALGTDWGPPGEH